MVPFWYRPNGPLHVTPERESRWDCSPLLVPSSGKHAQKSHILACFHCLLLFPILLRLRRRWCILGIGTLRDSTVGRGLDSGAVVAFVILFRASATHDGGQLDPKICDVG
jgi:hypothetical protein